MIAVFLLTSNALEIHNLKECTIRISSIKGPNKVPPKEGAEYIEKDYKSEKIFICVRHLRIVCANVQRTRGFLIFS